MIHQPALDSPRQEPREGKLYKSMEKPERKQSEWKAQNKRSQKSVPESAFGLKQKKILEVWREGSYKQSGKYKTGAPEGQSGRTVRS
jgi:hypothetical protein